VASEVPLQPSLPPSTTLQQDKTTAGQRKVNLIWEWTQAIISVLIVISNMAVAIFQGLNYGSNESHPVVLSSALFLVVGFYFARTNHAAIGGVGPKPSEQEYRGR